MIIKMQRGQYKIDLPSYSLTQDMCTKGFEILLCGIVFHDLGMPTP